MEYYDSVYVGLTVEKDNLIAVALPDEGGFVLGSDAVSPEPARLRRYLDRLAERFGGKERLRVVYELRDLDFSLQRALANWGIHCHVSSAMERRPDQRRKTGRRDAERLARLHRDRKLKYVEPPREQASAIAAAAYRSDLLRRAVATPQMVSVSERREARAS